MKQLLISTSLVFLAGLLIGGYAVFFHLRSSPEQRQPQSPVSGQPALDLNGEWEVTVPLGSKMLSRIRRLEEGRYKLVGFGVFGGIYELKGDRLVVVEPDDYRLTEFVWQLRDQNSLVLIESSSKTGVDYTGATLNRVK